MSSFMSVRTVAVVLIALVGCSSAKLSRPDLVRALVHLHELDASIPDTDSTGSPSWQARRRQALTALGISPDAFEESYTFYLQRPDQFMPIYQEVVDTLNVRRLAAMAVSSENPEAEVPVPAGPQPAANPPAGASGASQPGSTVTADTAGLGGPSRRRLNAIREARRRADSLRQAQPPPAP